MKGQKMRIRIDMKSVLLGFVLGAVVFLVMGQDHYAGASKADFGITVSSSLALVRANDGTLYVVDAIKGEAEPIEYATGPNRNKAFSLNRVFPQVNRNR
jgi:hypothetical protein